MPVGVTLSAGATATQNIGASVGFISFLPDPPVLTISETGSLQVPSQKSQFSSFGTDGFYDAGTDVAFVNKGSVHVEAAGPAVGAFSSSANWQFTNLPLLWSCPMPTRPRAVTDGVVSVNSGLISVTGQTQTVRVDVTFPTAAIHNADNPGRLHRRGEQHRDDLSRLVPGRRPFR